MASYIWSLMRHETFNFSGHRQVLPGLLCLICVLAMWTAAVPGLLLVSNVGCHQRRFQVKICSPLWCSWQGAWIVNAKLWVQTPPWWASFAGVSGVKDAGPQEAICLLPATKNEFSAGPAENLDLWFSPRASQKATCYPPPRMNSLPDRQRIQTCDFRQEHLKGPHHIQFYISLKKCELHML